MYAFQHERKICRLRAQFSFSIIELVKKINTVCNNLKKFFANGAPCHSLARKKVESMRDLYLVTGAAGHLGLTVVEELKKQGKAVRALVLPGDKATDKLPKGIQICEGDVLKCTSLDAFFSHESDESLTVIHCAGVVSIASRFIQRVYDVNCKGTQNILEMCETYGAKKLVYVSSVHAIPELPKGQVMTEIDNFHPADVVGQYAQTKSAASACVLEAAKRGLNASIVHPSGICGPNDWGRGHLTQLAIDYCKGRLPAGIDGGYDFVDVRDVARAIVACCEKGQRGECYILSNRYVTVREMLDLFHEVTGLRRVRLYVPVSLAKAFAPLCELYYRIARRTPLYTSYSLATLTGNSNFSHAKADRALGYTVRPFQETVADTVAWLKKAKRI